MSIKIKLIAVFSLLLMMVGGIVIFSRTNIANSAGLIEQIFDQPLMATNFARETLVGFLRAQKYVLQNSYDKARFQKLYEDAASSLDVVQERLVSKKSQPYLDQAKLELKSWADDINAGNVEKAKADGANFEQQTDLLIENEFSAAHDFVLESRAKVDRDNRVLLFMNGVCLFVSFAGGIFLFLSIYRPIRASIGVSEKIAAGHFDNDIRIRGSTEFRHLLAALKEMQSKLILHIEERQKVLNYLGQGFLMFDRNGICTPVYSRSCQTLLETTPPGKHIADILHLNASEKAKIERILKLVFDARNIESVELLARFAPQTYRHSRGLHVRLDYKPDIMAEGEALQHVIVIATDITKQIQAQSLAEDQMQLHESIVRVLHNRRAFGSYMRRSIEFTETMSGDISQPDMDEVRREVHTLKGGAGIFRLTALAQALHDFEIALTAPENTASVSVHCAILKREADAVRGKFSELLGSDVVNLEVEENVDRNMVLDFARYLTGRGLDDIRNEYVRRVCATSITAAFRQFDGQLEDLAHKFNKKILPIRFGGTDAPILVDHYRLMLESFVHLFRNIIDHGIEPPDSRVAIGKHENGQVEIHFGLSHDPQGREWLSIDIKDDGAGIDISKLKEKLHAQDPLSNWWQRSDKQVIEQLLAGGTSCKDTVTQYSGQGIGLSAVNQEVRKLGGTMSVQSISGRGTEFKIKVPYVLDITSPA